MRDRLAIHKLDALKVASLWSLGGSLALVDSAGTGVEPLTTTAPCSGRNAVEKRRGWSSNLENRESMGKDAIYFARRAAQELIAATEAEHPKAREAHLRMARHYKGLVAAGAQR